MPSVYVNKPEVREEPAENRYCLICYIVTLSPPDEQGRFFKSPLIWIVVWKIPHLVQCRSQDFDRNPEY